MANITPAELQNVELLSGFQPEELEQFAAALEVREFSEGENMIAGGDETRALFLILSGQVEIELTSFIEETVLLATLGPQEVFGDSTFFHAAAHQTTVRCIEAARVAVLPFAAYEAMLKARSSVAYHLGANAAHILAARLQAADQWIREVLEDNEEIQHRAFRDRYLRHFQPASFATPTGFIGLGVNW